MLGRVLRALASSKPHPSPAPVRLATAGEIGHEVVCRQRPNSASGRVHRGHQLLGEEHVGRAVTGLAHRVGLSALSGAERALDTTMRTARAPYFCYSCS